MVGVKIWSSNETFFIIGNFWEIVERLKKNQARFRFRSRRWRWPGNLASLEEVMHPFEVFQTSFGEAQKLQLVYDRNNIEPAQRWVNFNAKFVTDAVGWWEAIKFNPKNDQKRKKDFEVFKERVLRALEAVDIPPSELTKDQITALQQTQRTVEKFENRITKWSVQQAKRLRREEVLARFVEELGLSRENLIEAETSGGHSRRAFYEEVAGVGWMPHEISELKEIARYNLKEQKKLLKISNQTI